MISVLKIAALNNIVKYSLVLLLIVNNSAIAAMTRGPGMGCRTDACAGILHMISGGSNFILLLEIIGTIFLILYLVTRITEKLRK